MASQLLIPSTSLAASTLAISHSHVKKKRCISKKSRFLGFELDTSSMAYLPKTKSAGSLGGTQPNGNTLRKAYSNVIYRYFAENLLFCFGL